MLNKSILFILCAALTACAVICSVTLAAWSVSARAAQVYDGVLSPQPYSAAADSDYGWFERFRMDNFGPETEPLLAQVLETQLAFRPEGQWLYESYESCAVACATTLPAITVVQYGPDTAYGHETSTEDSYYFNHLHYLQGLQPNTTYHYRLVAQVKDGRQIVSEDRIFSTRAMSSDVIRIPQDMPGGAPYQLATPNRTYLLTQDMAADGTFAKIYADNITLDLGGHTAVYDNAAGAAGNYVPGLMHGQDIWHKRNVKIVNGEIKQGRRGSAASAPIELTQFYFPEGNTITGVTVDYYGADTEGFKVGGVTSVDHNVLVDRGAVIGNRHLGIHALSGTVGGAAWNSFRRFRHQGIGGTGQLRENELYCDSYDTNSYLILPRPESEVCGNKLFGVGYMPLGIGYETNLYCHDNIIYLHGTANRQRSPEYSRLSGLTGISVRLYNLSIDGYNGNIGTPVENLRYERNTIILKPWENCNIARGLWFMTGDRSTNTVFRDNVVKVEALSDHLHDGYRWDMSVACADVFGSETSLVHPGGLPPLTLLEDNTFITNVSFILFGSAYGSGIGNVLFNRTRLEKIGHHTSSYLPFTIGYWNWQSTANKLLNTSAGPGVDLSGDPTFFGSGLADMTLWNSYPLRFVDQYGNPLANTAVRIQVSGSWSYRSTNGLTIPPENMPETFDPRYELSALTDSQGACGPDFLEIYHFMRKPYVAERADYQAAVFSARGYKPTLLTLAEIKNDPQITLRKDAPGEFTGSLKGTIRYYNSQNKATVRLLLNGTVEQEAEISGGQPDGALFRQDFSFEGVGPGIYTLEITKAAHTSFTVHNIAVGEGETDLSQDIRPAVQLMTLRCGDINGDGNINNSDLTILWQQANYNRSASAAANGLCDLNGDGLVNNIDLTILWLAYNYNRGAIVID
jgi:hypothetical protein